MKHKFTGISWIPGAVDRYTGGTETKVHAIPVGAIDQRDPSTRCGIVVPFCAWTKRTRPAAEISCKTCQRLVPR